VSIRDTGFGIPPEELPRLFRMFNRSGRATARAHAGLGVGLPLSLKLAQLHGGTIEAHSDGPGHGSEFTLRLPHGTARRGRSESDASPVPTALPPRRVLVVDDNRDAADSLGMLLTFLGAEVRVARDGAEALQSFV